MKPKVLLISHNPMGTYTSMGKTFLSLFSEMEKEQLCQLYIYPSFPDVDRCASYYRVTDKEVLKSLPGRRRIGGEVAPDRVGEGQGQYEDQRDEAIYRSRKNKSALRRLLRDAMWKVARWNTPALQEWLDREAPTCIFVAPGVAKFLYRIALEIARERNLPIVTYICDEYYFVKEPDGWLDRIRLKLLQNTMEDLLEQTDHLVVISQELKEAYAGRFGTETTVVMTGSAYEIPEHRKERPSPESICYFGNVRCNRYLSLSEIGRELDGINRDLGTRYALKIYTSEKDPEILGVLEQWESVELCGFVSGTAFDEAFHGADLLLHVEAFDEASIDFVQHSVSTKIADSLASGIPLLAYGPKEISSMKHLQRNQCALLAHSTEELRGMLLTAFTDQVRRAAVTENALDTARVFHEKDMVGRNVKKILEGI